MVKQFLDSWYSALFMVLLLVVVAYVRFVVIGPPYYF